MIPVCNQDWEPQEQMGYFPLDFDRKPRGIMRLILDLVTWESFETSVKVLRLYTQILWFSLTRKGWAWGRTLLWSMGNCLEQLWMWVRPSRVKHLGTGGKGLELGFEKPQHVITWCRSMGLQGVARETAEKKQKVWDQGSQQKNMFMKVASVSGVKWTCGDGLGVTQMPDSLQQRMLENSNYL